LTTCGSLVPKKNLSLRGAELYGALADYYFARIGLWSAVNKSIPRNSAELTRTLCAVREGFENYSPSGEAIK